MSEQTLTKIESARETLPAASVVTPMQMLQLAAIRETYAYDPNTGVVSWKKKTNRCVVVGREAGFNWTSGRNTYGRFPAGVIDHRNGVGTDNRLSNLRDVSHTENLRNQRLSRANTSGRMGVDFHRASGQWRARIIVDQCECHIGLFASYEEAARARAAAERRYGFSENHGRRA